MDIFEILMFIVWTIVFIILFYQLDKANDIIKKQKAEIKKLNSKINFLNIPEEIRKWAE